MIVSLQPLLDENAIIVVHVLLTLAAFSLGLWQILGPKGGPRHRLVGWLWAALMVGVAGSSFWIREFRLFGPFSPIHLLSVVTLLSVPLAVHAARRRQIRRHRAIMLWLFWAALVVTGGFTLLPGRTMNAVIFGG